MSSGWGNRDGAPSSETDHAAGLAPDDERSEHTTPSKDAARNDGGMSEDGSATPATPEALAERIGDQADILGEGSDDPGQEASHND